MKLWLARLDHSRKQQPATLVFCILLIIPGVMAAILGDDVSQALTNLGAGVFSRIMGILLTIGCIMIFYSIVKNNSLFCVVGMTLAATGCFLYSAGVIIGLLPFGGIVAGFGFLSIGIFFALRISNLTRMATITFNEISAPCESDNKDC